jgi:predicted transcriptional regulator|nr:MAG TPA: hypothetical protein [Caudoviricetes sp.]
MTSDYFYFEKKPSVMMSINPKYCELIAAGKKTIEVRKTKPKIKPPLKCYIYCTLPKERFSIGQGNYACSDNLYLCDNKVKFGEGFEDIGNETTSLNGKVIGEFICDRITGGYLISPWSDYIQKKSCLTYSEIEKYAGDKPLWSWHISNLVIYDEPKELSEFKKYNRECWYADLGLAKRDCPECQNRECFLTQPPQSWCYVWR